MNATQCTGFDWSKIVIGSVQFGVRYGVANRSGIVSLEDAKKILLNAHSRGINTLDTAISYGNSEEILGKIGVKSWQVISKLPRIPDSVSDYTGYVLQQVEASLNRLKIQFLDGLLMHDPNQLLENTGDKIYYALSEIRRRGLAKNIGISIYDTQNLNALLRNRDFNIVQAPFSAFDQRMTNSGWLDELDKLGIEFHARSIFLQGLLLMKSRPSFFKRWETIFESWNEWLTGEELTPLEGALSCVVSNPKIKRIILGLDSSEHLQEVMDAIYRIERAKVRPPQLNVQDSILLNPSKWNLT